MILILLSHSKNQIPDTKYQREIFIQDKLNLPTAR